MGLETVHPQILEQLNKRMTTDQFAAAAALLREHDIDLRVFILVKPPFMREEEALDWAERSLDFAFDCGATAATLIPTRAGNGAMEELSRHRRVLAATPRDLGSRRCLWTGTESRTRLCRLVGRKPGSRPVPIATSPGSRDCAP